MAFTLQFPIGEEIRQLREAQRRLETDRRELLEQVGIKCLSLAQLAYRAKARGGQGSDGVTWDRLSRRTIEARVRQRAPAKKIVAERRALARQIKATRGPGSGGKRQRLQQRRRELSERMRALVDAELARHEIGVDTGLQRASGQPGFRGPDGAGGNVNQVEAGSVTVGYGREYSEYFDARRPLMPDEIPAAWREEFESIAQRWAERIVRETGVGE